MGKDKRYEKEDWDDMTETHHHSRKKKVRDSKRAASQHKRNRHKNDEGFYES